jgi:four helix bundle protein
MAEIAIYFEQLKVWQNSLNLSVEIYKSVKAFPEDEKFGLTSQLKRSSSAVPANIAEGFGRHTTKDKLQFYAIAYGSLLETKSHLYLANKLGYLNDEDRDSIMEKLVHAQKELSAFIRETRKYA